MAYYRFLILLALTSLLGCASHRQGSVCAEKQWRYDNILQSEEQRRWLKAEIEECRAGLADLEHKDSLRFQGIRAEYEKLVGDSSQDSGARSQDSTVAPPEQLP